MFIPQAISVIEMGQGALYYENVVKPKIHSFMGSVFEDMCRYYALEQGIQGKFGSFMTEAGSWWGTEQLIDEEGRRVVQTADIDVVGISSVDKVAVTGECKFKNSKIDKEIYETLVRRSRLISGGYRLTQYLLFSLSGFTNWFEKEKISDAIMITLDEMYK